MNWDTAKLTILFLALVAGSADWQTIEVQGLFSFRLPAGFTRRSSTDERAEYYKGDTKVIYVWGGTESGAFDKRRQPWMKDYQESTTRIRGKRANIRTYLIEGKQVYRAELNVGNWEHGEVQLYLLVEGKDRDTLSLARQIFESVSFPIPPPEHRPTDHR